MPEVVIPDGWVGALRGVYLRKLEEAWWAIGKTTHSRVILI